MRNVNGGGKDNLFSINVDGSKESVQSLHPEDSYPHWAPNGQRIVFSASAYVNKQVNIFRPFVTIPAILDAGKMIKALNPAHVVPGHGVPGGTEIFDEGAKYYALLAERVDAMRKAGKSLDDIKKDLKMPEYASWFSQDRMPTNIDASYRMLTGR